MKKAGLTHFNPLLFMTTPLQPASTFLVPVLMSQNKVMTKELAVIEQSGYTRNYMHEAFLLVF